MSEQVAVKRALVSVYDKTGLADLARALEAAGVEIVSTGSTAAAIASAGVPVTRVEDVTGFPECLDGRVKTLHPAVHAGLLADPAEPDHRAQLDDLGIAAFQLLVSNLYPFEATVASGASPAECVEQIDIGGPAMVRAAAKNHKAVAVITDPSRYPDVVQALADGGFTLAQRRRLAAQAFAHTARYDIAVASWFASDYAPDSVAAETGWPDVTGAMWRRQDVLRYGENPHQRAALYLRAGPGGGAGVAGAEQLHGKAMSYNNYVDAAAAWRSAFDFGQPCVAIVKHTNPCGIAIGPDVAQAHRKANDCDPVSAFGGVIAANTVVTHAMAKQVAEVFTEVIIAPGFEDEALEILTARKNLRVLRAPARVAGAVVELRPLGPDLLMQEADHFGTLGDEPGGWELKAGQPVSGADLADLAFAWRVCRSVKSNAIVVASGGATIGVGMGQVNRVDAARLAVTRAGDRVPGSVAASDAYFPFPDGLQVLADAGVRAIVEPGGSVKDGLVIEAAQAAGVSLYFTGTRHFFH